MIVEVYRYGEFWVLPIPIIFLSESTDTDHQTDIDLAHVK